MNFAELKMRNTFGVGPLVAFVRHDNHSSVYVQTRVGIWFRHFDNEYMDKYTTMGCLRKVLVNDFYYDQDMWARCSRSKVPGIAEEVLG